jgi:hypothetical protein
MPNVQIWLSFYQAILHVTGSQAKFMHYDISLASSQSNWRSYFFLNMDFLALNLHQKFFFIRLKKNPLL